MNTRSVNTRVVHGFVNEFKAFALKGNVVDLAIAVVIGASFGKIVSSLVDNIIMPLASMLVGGIELSSLTVTMNDTAVTYGVFVQSVVDFIIIALAIFVAIKVLRVVQQKEEAKPEKEKVVEPTEEVKLLREIRDTLQR